MTNRATLFVEAQDRATSATSSTAWSDWTSTSRCGPATIVIDHPNYQVTATLSAETLASLAEDFG